MRIHHGCVVVLRGMALAVGIAAIGPAGAQSPGAANTEPIVIRVDATTNFSQKILEVSERIPASPGPLRLRYPRWLPGYHGIGGEVVQLAGLVVEAGGKRLPWRRDPADMNTFVVDVPAGVSSVDVRFQSLSAADSSPYRPPWSRQVVGLQWSAAVLYPAGRPVSQIAMLASVKLPAGWRHGSALRASEERDGWITFEPVSLETLVDSPVYAAQHYRRIELDAAGAVSPAVLHLFGDRPERIQPADAQVDAHRNLVRQATMLFGSRPWRHYDLMIASGEGLNDTALEHHESSENVYSTDYFKDWPTAARRREDVAHEFVHAWNGKYRRPADLWAADFNTPTQNSLLWVYEGLTEYWGVVIAARAGLVSPELIRHRLGRNAAYNRDVPGRRWRNLQDTTWDPALPVNDRSWYDWQRGWDYYVESALVIWLDADTLIRAETNGLRSLDDFARGFFGGNDADLGPRLYTFDDVVAAMQAVHPHDWRAFFRERLDRTAAEVSLEGLERSGWRVGFADKRSDMDLAALDPEKPTLALGYSLGLGVAKDGKLNYVTWDSPAFKGGLSPQDQIVAVAMQAYSIERIEAAVAANKDGSKPIELLVKRDDVFRNVALDVRTGLRYPVLERIEGRPDLLADILRPR